MSAALPDGGDDEASVRADGCISTDLVASLTRRDADLRRPYCSVCEGGGGDER